MLYNFIYVGLCLFHIHLFYLTSGYSVLDTDLYTLQTQIHLIIILKFL